MKGNLKVLLPVKYHDNSFAQQGQNVERSVAT